MGLIQKGFSECKEHPLTGLGSLHLVIATLFLKTLWEGRRGSVFDGLMVRLQHLSRKLNVLSPQRFKLAFFLFQEMSVLGKRHYTDDCSTLSFLLALSAKKIS